ncbi:MAG: CAP domain-containing protein [Chloroflexota bacterium]
MFRLLSSSALLVFSLSLIVQPAAAQVLPAAQDDDPAAQEIIKTINTWRIAQGLWPLRENATLDKMALDQANYVLSLPTMPQEGALHLGKFGEAPPARANLPQYAWPPYGTAQNTAVGEIAYTGYNAVAAQHFWDGSPIHHRTALSPAYREIGAAAIPQRWGHLYFVDFGARPNVLPAIADMTDRTLYLTNERYTYARSPWIRNVLKVRLFDADGRPLDSDWETWQPEIHLPVEAGSSLYVEYLDESGVMVLAPVSLTGATNTPAPTQNPSAVPTLVPTTMPTATPLQVVINNPTAAPTRAAGVAATPVPATAVPTTAPTAAPVTTATTSVLLVYDAKSLTLLNSTLAPINMSGVVFVGQTSTFAAARWSTQWLSGTLTALGGNNCLQVWSWLEKNAVDKPTSCRSRRSALTVAPEQLFWKQGDFQVMWGQTTLASCRAAATQCAFALPS